MLLNICQMFLKRIPLRCVLSHLYRLNQYSLEIIINIYRFIFISLFYFVLFFLRTKLIKDLSFCFLMMMMMIMIMMMMMMMIMMMMVMVMVYLQCCAELFFPLLLFPHFVLDMLKGSRCVVKFPLPFVSHMTRYLFVPAFSSLFFFSFCLFVIY